MANRIDFVTARLMRWMLRLRRTRCALGGLREAKGIAGVLTSIVVLVVGSIGDVGGQSLSFSIRDTGRRLAVLHSAMLPIYWLDEGTIIYNGYEPEVTEIRKSDGRTIAKDGVYVLDIERNLLTRHADASGFLCYRDGFVRYLTRYDDSSRVAVIREGKLGDEREFVVDRDAQSKRGRFNPLTCRDYDPHQRGNVSGDFLPLLDGHGVLEFGRRGPASRSEIYSAKLHLSDGTSQITLPISGDAISRSLIEYYAFANSYIVGYVAPKGPPSEWPKNATHRVYMLKSQGNVSEASIPGGAWSDRRLSTIVLTSAGIVFSGGQIRRYLNPGTAGLYLSNGNRVVKIESGLLHGIGVSPSGCKVAAAMQTYIKTPDPTTIRVVNVCGGGSNK